MVLLSDEMDIFVWCVAFRSDGEALQHLEEVYSFPGLILAASSLSEWTLHLRAPLLSCTINFTWKCSRMLRKKKEEDCNMAPCVGHFGTHNFKCVFYGSDF